MTRPLTIAGNWKMYKTRKEAALFIEELKPHLQSKDRVWLAPSYLSISDAMQSAKDSPLQIGAQNLHDEAEGAFTGEVSAPMLKECGVSFVLCGHSERRTLFREDDQMIARKVQSALQSGITPLLCVGETQEQRDRGEAHDILAKQLEIGLSHVKDLSQVVIAYEPVWAIGTGKTATPELAQEAHALARQCLREKFGAVADQLSLLYGGSVKESNAQELLSEPDIDGALIGGASLKVESFAKIIEIARGIS